MLKVFIQSDDTIRKLVSYGGCLLLQSHCGVDLFLGRWDKETGGDRSWTTATQMGMGQHRLT